MPECTFRLEKLLHNAVFPVASWKLGLPLSFTFCELYAAGELSLNQKRVMMRASVLFVFIYFFYSRSTNSIQWHMAFIYMVIKAYFFICFLAVRRPEARTFSFLKVLVYKFGKYLPFILLLDISFSYHLLKRFSLYNNCFHHFYHHEVKIAYRHKDFYALTIYFTPTCLWSGLSMYILSSSWIQKYPAALHLVRAVLVDMKKYCPWILLHYHEFCWFTLG